MSNHSSFSTHNSSLASGGPLDFLLVEDSPGDVRLIREALRDGKVRDNLHVVPDGADAMAFLRRKDTYANAPRPDLILLDLNMPKKDGREVLAEIKANDHLRCIPVIVLTTSQAQEDILETNANCYVTKPVDLDEFLAVVQSIEDFWLTVVKLPPHSRR